MIKSAFLVCFYPYEEGPVIARGDGHAGASLLLAVSAPAPVAGQKQHGLL
jgi:hypothetical protein